LLFRGGWAASNKLFIKTAGICRDWLEKINLLRWLKIQPLNETLLEIINRAKKSNYFLIWQVCHQAATREF